MNIQYKQRGIAVKFDGNNWEEFAAIPEIRRNIEERFSTVESWINTCNGVPLVRLAEHQWLRVNNGQYFISIEDLDLVMNEEEFNNLFEEA